MGTLYAIGVLAGLGAAFGLVAAAIVPRWPVAALPAAGLGVAVGVLASSGLLWSLLATKPSATFLAPVADGKTAGLMLFSNF
jgi:hypothetical protein